MFASPDRFYATENVGSVARSPRDWLLFKFHYFVNISLAIFGSKLGFKTGLLHIIFKLNHACRAEEEKIVS